MNIFHDKIKELLLELQRPVAPEEIGERLEESPQECARALKEMEEQGTVMITRRGRAALPEQMGLVFGRVQGSARGFAFLIPKDGSDDMFIPGEDMNGALHGDMVWVRRTHPGKGGESTRCQVVSIVKRSMDKVIGVFEKDSEFGGYVIPDDTRILEDMLIPPREMKGAATGDKVSARIMQYPGPRRPMIGSITEVLGREGEEGVDVLSIIRRLDLPDEFPKSVLRQAQNMGSGISEEELKGRKDWRGILTITIDGADARDLDDAVSLAGISGGKYRLWVHIADVSHYVRENGPIDREAYKRGTSVYFPDRVLPMLPKELSNGLCSLNPGEDKLAMSLMMDIGDQGRVLSYELNESVIRSDYRMTYGDVNAIFEGDKKLRDRYAPIISMLEDMRKLMGILRAERDRRGSVDFSVAEAEIVLDGKGRAAEVYPRKRGEAERMIEEFMLIANETVARFGSREKLPLVYRVHEAPDPLRVEELNRFLQTLGYGLKHPRSVKPMAVQSVLRRAKGSPEENVVSRVTLRAMSKAKYSPDCDGHFGLAMDYYCHFTSPIRRYPDLMVHRALKDGIHNRLRGRRREKWDAMLEEAANHCSDRELAAVEAERAAYDLKKCEFIHGHLGEEYEGIISGMVQQGFFVELDSTVEGMVRAASLMDDYYILDEKNYCFTGRSSGRQFRLGDRVRVRVAAADLDTSKVTFELIQEGEKEQCRRSRSTKGRNSDKINIHHRKKEGPVGDHKKRNKKGRGKPKSKA